MPIQSMRRVWPALLSAFLLLAAAGAGAQERVPADLGTVRQKAQYVENLVTSSVSVARIEQQGDAAARDKLAEARALVEEAKRELDAGAADAANAKLDQALTMVNTEIRRLSGDEVVQAHDREVYERRLAAVRAFLGAYARVAEEGASRAAAAQAETLRTLIAKAEGEAAQQDYAKAIATLDAAYRQARGEIREMRQGQTLTRSLDFETVEEAYDYELGRNASHFLLLQYAQQEKTPQGSVVQRIEGNRQQAEKLRAEAERKAAAGEHAEAIGLLNESTDLLLKAIRMSGLFVPG